MECAYPPYKSHRKNEFNRWLLHPFLSDGNYDKLENAGDSAMFTVPLISLAPAILIGYVYNFMTQNTSILECSPAFDTSICEGDVCCKLVSQCAQWTTFMPTLSGALFAWGLVKILATFLIRHSDMMKSNDGQNPGSQLTGDAPNSGESGSDCDDHGNDNDVAGRIYTPPQEYAVRENGNGLPSHHDTTESDVKLAFSNSSRTRNEEVYNE